MQLLIRHNFLKTRLFYNGNESNLLLKTQFMYINLCVRRHLLVSGNQEYVYMFVRQKNINMDKSIGLLCEINHLVLSGKCIAFFSSLLEFSHLIISTHSNKKRISCVHLTVTILIRKDCVVHIINFSKANSKTQQKVLAYVRSSSTSDTDSILYILMKIDRGRKLQSERNI